MDSQLASIVWMTICAALVMLMQGGFCLLESGFCRAKHTINVAIKNLVDFCVAIPAFFLLGFGLMCGQSWHGVIGTTYLAPVDTMTPWLWAFLLYQLVFCGTATTIVSGAVAERMRLVAYVFGAMVIAGFIYPVFVHWAWGAALWPNDTAFLAKSGVRRFCRIDRGAFHRGMGGACGLRGDRRQTGPLRQRWKAGSHCGP